MARLEVVEELPEDMARLEAVEELQEYNVDMAEAKSATASM